MLFYEAVHYYKSTSNKVRLFGRFLGFFEALELNNLDYYIQTLKNLDTESPLYLPIIQNSSEVLLGPFDKVVSLLNKMEDKVCKQQIEILTENIKCLKKAHKKYTLGVVDVDNAFEVLLEGFQIMRDTSKDILDLFYSGVLGNSKMLGYFEFICLFKYIENQQDEGVIEQVGLIFLNKCDQESIYSEEKCMSYENFLSMCIENQWFKQENIQRFIGDINVSILREEKQKFME